MIYEDVIKDFAERTKKNLEAIERVRLAAGDVYEATQLVNSCLGLLVFPKEQYINSIPETTLKEMEKEGWPIPKVVGEFGQVPNLKELIRYLRNSIAHFNIEFIGDKENQIHVVRLWNCFQGRITWQVELTVDDLRRILEKFSSQLIHWRNDKKQDRIQPERRARPRC